MNHEAFSMQDLVPVMLESLENGGVFPVTVNGNSMYPLLRNGRDTVYFASLKGRSVRRGDIFLFQRKNGAYVMHRVYKICADGTYTFVGDNQTELEPNIEVSQLRAFVPFIERDGRKISCEKGLHHRMLVLYMRLHIRWPKLSYMLLAVNSKLNKCFLKVFGGNAK